MQSLAELQQAGVERLVHGKEDARQQRLALSKVALFLQQQVAEPLFEAVDQLQRRMCGQINGEVDQLF